MNLFVYIGVLQTVVTVTDMPVCPHSRAMLIRRTFVSGPVTARQRLCLNNISLFKNIKCVKILLTFFVSTYLYESSYMKMKYARNYIETGLQILFWRTFLRAVYKSYNPDLNEIVEKSS